MGSIHSQPRTSVAASTTIRAGKPPDPPGVEGGEAEALLVQSAGNDAGDQEARYHEEDIDADEAARQRLRKAVEVHHQRHRDGAQAVYVGPIAAGRRRRFRLVHEHAITRKRASRDRCAPTSLAGLRYDAIFG